MTRALALLCIVLVTLPALAHDEPCDPKPWRSVLGLPVDHLQDLHLPELFRVIYPDSNREVAPDTQRLNFTVDAESIIRDVHCG